MQSAVSVSGVSKRFRIYHERNQSLKAALMRGGRSKFEEFWALRDVDVEIPHGKTYGLVGHNGSGKSTLLKCMAKILVPDNGTIRTHGRVSALLELGAGFHPELSGRDNVYLNGSILGLSKRDIDDRFDDIVGFAGLEQFIDSPVKNYSSGMYVRLGFSVAINVEPDVLLVDEVLAVGDEEFQRRSMEKFRQFRRDGRTVVIVSHALESVKAMCDEVAWLDHGKLLETGDPRTVVDRYSGGVDLARPEVREAPGWQIDVTAAATRDGEVLRPGAGADVRIGWQEPAPAPDVRVEAEVRTTTGLVLGSLPTGGAVPAADRGVVVHVPEWPLAAGEYLLAVRLVDPEGRVLDERNDALELTVASSGPTTATGPVEFRGSSRSAPA